MQSVPDFNHYTRGGAPRPKETCEHKRLGLVPDTGGIWICAQIGCGAAFRLIEVPIEEVAWEQAVRR